MKNKMGCITSCEKCGCSQSYYYNSDTRKTNNNSKSCRGHVFQKDTCVDCGAKFGSAWENCYHRWK